MFEYLTKLYLEITYNLIKFHHRDIHYRLDSIEEMLKEEFKGRKNEN